MTFEAILLEPNQAIAFVCQLENIDDAIHFQRPQNHDNHNCNDHRRELQRVSPDYSAKTTESRVEDANEDQHWRDVVQIDTRDLREGKRRRVAKQWAQNDHVDEEQEAGDSSNLAVVALLEIRIAAESLRCLITQLSNLCHLRNSAELMEDWQVDVAQCQGDNHSRDRTGPVLRSVLVHFGWNAVETQR